MWQMYTNNLLNYHRGPQLTRPLRQKSPFVAYSYRSLTEIRTLRHIMLYNEITCVVMISDP